MPILTEPQINDLVKDRAQFNVSTDSPVSTAELLRAVNDAYQDIWDASGGHLSVVKHTNAWDETATDTTGVLNGKLTDIEDVRFLFWCAADALPAEGDAVMDPADLARINYLRNDQGFGAYGKGKLYSVIKIPSSTAGTVTTNCTWNKDTNIITGPGAGELANVDIGWTVDAQTGIAAGTAAISKISSNAVGLADITLTNVVPASVVFTPPVANRIRVDYWPAIASKYIGMQYVPQFTPLTAGATPNVNDIESRDIALLAAARIAPLLGRAELVPGILLDLSSRTAAALERKVSSMMHAKQDR